MAGCPNWSAISRIESNEMVIATFPGPRVASNRIWFPKSFMRAREVEDRCARILGSGYYVTSAGFGCCTTFASLTVNEFAIKIAHILASLVGRLLHSLCSRPSTVATRTTCSGTHLSETYGFLPLVAALQESFLQKGTQGAHMCMRLRFYRAHA